MRKMVRKKMMKRRRRRRRRERRTKRRKRRGRRRMKRKRKGDSLLRTRLTSISQAEHPTEQVGKKFSKMSQWQRSQVRTNIVTVYVLLLLCNTPH